MRRFYGVNFDLCVLQDPLPCSSINNLLKQNNVSPEHISVLQIDIEGYEYILIKGLIEDIQDESLPRIIHFEHKVMKNEDIQNPLNVSSRLEVVSTMLTGRGYILHDQGEDYLAIKLSDRSTMQI